jgi:hypothetical protein
MASPAQITANRLNALKSTGPRTDDGKTASRVNALRHGADATLAVIPGEDPAALEELTRSYRARFQPAGPEETFLVDTLIRSDWNRTRYLRIQADIMNHAVEEMGPCDNPLGALFASNSPAARAFERSMRHYEAADRAWFQAFKQLERLLQQAADEEAFFRMSAAAPAPAALPPTPADPRNWVRSGVPASTPPPALPIAPERAEKDLHLALRL